MYEITRRELVIASAAAAALFGLKGRVSFVDLAHAQKAMDQGFHRYKVGDIEVTALYDGMWEKPHDPNFIKSVTVEETKAALQAAGLPTDIVPVPFTPNLVKIKDKLILTDSGTGGQTGGPKAGTMMKHLAAAGVEPADINAVVITHFHSDHIFGLMTKAPENKVVFPNAEILVPATEYRYWTDPAALEKLPEARRPLAKRIQEMFPLMQAKVRQYSGNEELLPGMRAIDTPGHTPGHTSLHLSSGTDQLIVLGDVTNIPALFVRNPGWHAAFDQDPAMAEASRRRIFDRVAADKIMVSGYHFPFPAAGMIAKDGNGYVFAPAS
jgi:glyoxylase-like metal-dependent hydrolase (beta-lactamase superfamily II)